MKYDLIQQAPSPCANTQAVEPTFTRPLPSRATRTPSPRSKASSRGHIPAHTPADPRRRIRHFESKLEQKVLYLLLARSDIADIWDQPPPINYVDEDGRRHPHTFDYLATLTDGRRIAIAVKPSAVAERQGFRNTLKHVRASTPLAYAHEVVLVTERSYTPAAARNAEKLHAFRRTADPEADRAIAGLVSTLNSPMTVAELVSRSGLSGRGFRAVFRAIFAGVLRVVDAGDILPSTIITREAL